MKPILALCCAILFLAGCATTPIPTQNAIPVPAARVIDDYYLQQRDGTGEVIVKRDSGLGGSACTSRVYLDAKAIADLWTGEKVELFLPEGEYLVGAEPNGICGGGLTESKAVVKAGKVQVFRIGYGSNGDYHLLPTAF